MGIRAPTFYDELVEDALNACQIRAVGGGYGLVTTLQRAQRVAFINHGSSPQTIKRWVETYQAYGLVTIIGAVLVLTHMDISARCRYEALVKVEGLSGKDLSAEVKR